MHAHHTRTHVQHINTQVQHNGKHAREVHHSSSGAQRLQQ